MQTTKVYKTSNIIYSLSYVQLEQIFVRYFSRVYQYLNCYYYFDIAFKLSINSVVYTPHEYKLYLYILFFLSFFFYLINTRDVVLIYCNIPSVRVGSVIRVIRVRIGALNRSAKTFYANRPRNKQHIILYKKYTHKRRMTN